MSSSRFLSVMVVIALAPLSVARADGPAFESDLAIHDDGHNPAQCFEIDFPTHCDAGPTFCTHVYARLNDLSQAVPFAPVMIPIEWTDEWSHFSGRLKAADQKLLFTVEYPVGGSGKAKANGTTYSLLGGAFEIRDPETTTACETRLPEVRIVGQPLVAIPDGEVGSVAIRLDAPFARNINVKFEVRSWTLTLDVDYGETSLSPVLISAGDTSADITLENIPGARTGTLEVRLLQGADYYVGSPSRIEVAIQP